VLGLAVHLGLGLLFAFLPSLLLSGGKTVTLQVTVE